MKKNKSFLKQIALFVAFSTLFTLKAVAFTPVLPDPIQGDTIIGQEQEFVKNFDKTFAVGKNEVVMLANKYGNVEVKTGATNRVVVNVRVRVNATSQEEAQKMFDRINITFSNGPEFVKTETIIESKNDGYKWYWNKSQTADFSIDYEVTMPVNNRLDLSNKYGTSHVAALNAAVKIEHKYGDFKLDGATAAVIDLAYGGGQLGTISALNASVSYGKLTSPNVNALKMKSKYSAFKFGKMQLADIQSAYDDYQIDDVNTLKIEGKYGDLNVGIVETLTANSNYTDFKIKRIEGNADFDTRYGDVHIGSVKTGFGTLNIKGSYTDYSLAIDPSVSYQLDATGTYGNLQNPASMKTSLNSESNYRREVIGTVGNPNTKSVVRVRLTHGNFKIR
jgi:Putative adhesin